MTDIVLADSQSEDADTRGCNLRETKAVNALDCSNRRGIAGVMVTMTMCG